MPNVRNENNVNRSSTYHPTLFPEPSEFNPNLLNGGFFEHCLPCVPMHSPFAHPFNSPGVPNAHYFNPVLPVCTCSPPDSMPYPMGSAIPRETNRAPQPFQLTLPNLGKSEPNGGFKFPTATPVKKMPNFEREHNPKQIKLIRKTDTFLRKRKAPGDYRENELKTYKDQKRMGGPMGKPNEFTERKILANMSNRVRLFWKGFNNNYPFVFKQINYEFNPKGNGEVTVFEKFQYNFKRVNPNQTLKKSAPN